MHTRAARMLADDTRGVQRQVHVHRLPAAEINQVPLLSGCTASLASSASGMTHERACEGGGGAGIA